MKLDHLVVLVRSLDASLPWYTALLALLGFEKSRDHVWGNADGVYLDLKEADPGTAPYARRAPGLNHLGFTAPDEAALDRVRDAMAARSFEVPEKQTFADGTIATFFKDPDGMRLEVSVYPVTTGL